MGLNVLCGFKKIVGYIKAGSSGFLARRGHHISPYHFVSYLAVAMRIE